MRGLLRFLIFVGVLCSIAGFVGGLWWVFDLFANFRPHLAVGGTLLGGVALVVGLKLEGFVALFAVAANVAAVAQLYTGEPATDADLRQFTVLTANVNRAAGDPAKLAAIITEANPDIIGLLEVDQRWVDALAPTLKPWPYKLERLRDDNFGIALYAKRPLRGGRSVRMGQVYSVPFLVAQTRVAGRPIQLILAHPPPPITGGLAADRDAMMAAIAALDGPMDRVVMGDFNATPWSAPFRQMLTDGDLRMGRQGRGIHATWPAALGPAGVPIDHILVGGRVSVLHHEVLGDMGSDHRPIRARLGTVPPDG